MDSECLSTGYNVTADEIASMPTTGPLESSAFEDLQLSDKTTEAREDGSIFLTEAEVTELKESDKFGSISTLCSEGLGEDEYGAKISENYTAVPYGLQPKSEYEHGKKNTDIIGLSYNGRMRQFVILDAKGVTTWKPDLSDQNVSRALLYNKFEYRVITNLVYAKKHNVYFALGKDFSLKVLNRDFEETCRVDSDLRSILFMIFNPTRDELITGGVGGTKVWKYHQVAERTWTEIKPMANYRLKLQYELPNVGGSWVKRVELDLLQQHLYCCSDSDLYAYDMDGKEVFRFERAHNMSITGCAFSQETQYLLTASVDSEVKVWSIGGGLIHTFRGHSRAVSGLILHPETSTLFLTSSLDGSVRIWSLNTMDSLYSLVVSTDGVLWLGLTDDKQLYMGTMRSVSVWSLNRSFTFWAPTRSKLTDLRLVGGQGKSKRVLTVGEDNSVRIFDRIKQKNLSTVLPPPALSPLERIRDIVYNRLVSVVYLLINTKEIWLYTTRTDPACRIAVWNALDIQEQILREEQRLEAELIAAGKKSSASTLNKRGPSHRATEQSQGSDVLCDCHSVLYLNSYAMMWTEEGMCTPIQDNYLLLGLEDGRILFMDPVVCGKKYFQFRANKDAIVRMTHDSEHGCLWTQCDLGDAVLIQIWSLPQLELRHEVYCPPDVTGYVRLNYSFITGHKNGVVLHHILQDIEATGPLLYRPRFGQNDDDMATSDMVEIGKADHVGPITSISACHSLGIFCTASPGGVVKVWERTKILLTEISLDNTLCTACFLNNNGDLLVGFKNHLFHIDHTRVCPSITVGEDTETDYAESEIYEDPAVLYEGVTEDPDPVNLDNYLVPFNFDFSKEFLEGKLHPMPAVEEDEPDDDAVSEISAAPTAVYQSPYSTPHHLSLVDLTLTSEPTKQDLKLSLQKMLQKQAGQRSKRPAFERNVWTDDECEEVARHFEMPQFGLSPGPSPTPSPPSTISTPSDFDVSEGGESTPVSSDEGEMDFQPIDVPPDSTPAKAIVKPLAAQTDTDSQRTSRLNHIKIDAKSLMKETKLKAVKEADHGKEPEVQVQEKPAKTVREVKKKEISSQRKRPPAQIRPPTTQSPAKSHIRTESQKPGRPQVTALVEESDESDEDIKPTPRISSQKPLPKRTVQPPITPKKKSAGRVRVKPRTVRKAIVNVPMTVSSTEKVQIPQIQETSMTGTGTNQDRSETSLSQNKVVFVEEPNSLLSDVSDSEDQDKTHSSSKDHVSLRPPSATVGMSPSSSPILEVSEVVSDETLKEQSHDNSSQLSPHHKKISVQLPTPENVSASSLSDLAPTSQDRATSPALTIISDHGSEWTVLPPDDSHETDELGARVVMSAVNTRRRYSHASAVEEAKYARPHTAIVIPTDPRHLQRQYKEAMASYKSMPGTPDQLYRNDGNMFVHYHDRLIERHQLLQMQKALRIQSAQEKREAMQRETEEKNTAILQRAASAVSRGKSRPDSGFIDIPHDSAAPSEKCYTPLPGMWSDYSTGGTLSMRMNSQRPATASPTMATKQYHHLHSNQHSGRQSRMMSSRASLLQRPATAGAIDEEESESTLQQVKSQLGKEFPFRARIRSRKPGSAKKTAPKAEKIDIQLLDPRNPSSQKPQPRKSIPSKCSRYILITNGPNAAGKIVPTPLEEQLIMERFPEKQQEWLTGYLRTTRMHHGIPALDPKTFAFDKRGTLQPGFLECG